MSSLDHWKELKDSNSLKNRKKLKESFTNCLKTSLQTWKEIKESSSLRNCKQLKEWSNLKYLKELKKSSSL